MQGAMLYCLGGPLTGHSPRRFDYQGHNVEQLDETSDLARLAPEVTWELLCVL